MRMPFLAALSAALLAWFAPAAAAQTRFFVAGGPTGTSGYGFRGGWGAALGVERRIAPAGAFLIRFDGSAVPATPDVYAWPYRYPAGTASLGESGRGARDATLLGLMAGLRLKSAGPVATYLDALVGVGWLNWPVNTAPASLSVGSGIEVRALPRVAVFADVHYDFFFAERADTPLVPVRLGLIVP